MFSVVVPAHDEEGVIARCLAFVADLQPDEAEVVVVANGCADDTAALARRVPGVQVIELAEGGKSGALNAGDAAVSALPRVYLDADIEVTAATLRRLVSALDASEPRVASPRPHFELTGRPWTVRAFYRVYLQLPYVRDNLVGLGIYALSAAGRARFDLFPALTADDLFTQRLFASHERVVTSDEFIIQTPRTLAALVAVRTRVAYGNSQLAQSRAGDAQFQQSTDGTLRALLELVRRSPLLAPSAAVYVGVVAAARYRSRRRGAATWQRDATTR